MGGVITIIHSQPINKKQLQERIQTWEMMWYQRSARAASDNPNKFRCCETTLKQTVCKRKVGSKGAYCWQHPRGGNKSRAKPKQQAKPKSVPVKKKATPKVTRKPQIKRQTQARQRSQFSRIFQRLDTDHNGMISREEFGRNWFGGNRRKVYA